MMIKERVLIIGYVVAAACIITAFVAVVYLMRQNEPPSNCRIDSKGMQRISFPEDERVYIANVTVTYCNLKPEGAQ